MDNRAMLAQLMAQEALRGDIAGHSARDRAAMRLNQMVGGPVSSAYSPPAAAAAPDPVTTAAIPAAVPIPTPRPEQAAAAPIPTPRPAPNLYRPGLYNPAFEPAPANTESIRKQAASEAKARAAKRKSRQYRLG
jgi:hypothetical protein